MPRKKPILVQIDVDLLGRVDAHAAVWTHGNRSRLIGDALEQLLASHAAFVQRQRQPDPRGGWLPGPKHTADSTAESRPLTADLMDRR